jgi:hypothetical protein
LRETFKFREISFYKLENKETYIQAVSTSVVINWTNKFVIDSNADKVDNFIEKLSAQSLDFQPNQSVKFIMMYLQFRHISGLRAKTKPKKL